MKQPTATAEVREGERCVGVARYYVTSCNCEIAPVQTYGVSVSFTGEQGASYSDQVNDICFSQKQAEDLLHLLAAHTVTPVSLRDVVEDYLADR
ncbi:DUF6514 family protein [Ethanoligenens harbinense]|uniref:Uncharacterized protein n=1 Tax=Ethanoligenens harbinense (strain DSM 18485 / JCM 12961 / CGMCC 1.5033 / YUAN-3) TaxID=663278 RepID=E6U7Q2_ETHHY|nr:hypothetical protein Ethha_2682 [Ethanoligenens harbinense YUAN-3]AVQ97179.1 hypothetical protein CXQ68_13765 [Ethanoligenens harbinense YUAN-3]AYF39842.1 hypothetical protein CXP51_13665 [Ethanoligenens harbinense]AYF42674.1 hypothetical protein CN246_14245 [Ethanoligenens harbinense]QCN93423.1 hypothetical protein DRA42_13815 [Ethanoligenens harbinense]